MPAGGGGRTRSGTRYHIPRRPFFSPPYQRDDPRSRVTEYPLHRRQWSETGKPVCVRQTAGFACLGHPPIMPNFCVPATGILCRINKAFSTAQPQFLPTRNHEEPLYFYQGTPSRRSSSDPTAWLVLYATSPLKVKPAKRVPIHAERLHWMKGGKHRTVTDRTLTICAGRAECFKAHKQQRLIKVTRRL